MRTPYRKICSLLLPLILFFSLGAQGQLVKPPIWSVSLAPGPLQVGEKATLVLEAQIPMGWYVYSNDFDKNLGPLLTQFVPSNSSNYTLSGKLLPINPKKKFDEVWKGDVTYFMGKGRFEQEIVLNTTSGAIEGSLEYQMCSDLTGQCVNYELAVNVPFNAKEAAKEATPSEEESLVDSVSLSTSESLLAESKDTTETSLLPQAPTVPLEEEPETLLGFMVLAFLAGLAALLTPCVFPMIPMTVSFFTGRAKKEPKVFAKPLSTAFQLSAFTPLQAQQLQPFKVQSLPIG